MWLCSTFHIRPEQAPQWAAAIERVLPLLRGVYQGICVSVTNVVAEAVVPSVNGSRSLTDILRAHGVVCEVGPTSIGANHRNALLLGLRHMVRGTLHYCDFDRIVFWAGNFPDELKRFVIDTENPAISFPYRHGFGTMVPREQEWTAWNSHPLPQTATEGIVLTTINSVYRLTHLSTGVVSLADTQVWFDPLGTSIVADSEFVDVLLETSIYHQYPQIEWMTLLLSFYQQHFHALDSSRAICYPVNGLGFETLEIDRYAVDPGERSAASSKLKTLDCSKEEALYRTNLAIDLLDNFESTLTMLQMAPQGWLTLITASSERLHELKQDLVGQNSGEIVAKILRRFQELHASL